MERKRGSEIGSTEVEELANEHRVKFTTEKLQHIQEQKKMLTKEMSSDENEKWKDASTASIKNICAKWNVENFVDLYHPDKATNSRALYKFNEIVVIHLRKVFRWRQKQVAF